MARSGCILRACSVRIMFELSSCLLSSAFVFKYAVMLNYWFSLVISIPLQRSEPINLDEEAPSKPMACASWKSRGGQSRLTWLARGSAVVVNGGAIPRAVRVNPTTGHHQSYHRCSRILLSAYPLSDRHSGSRASAPPGGRENRGAKQRLISDIRLNRPTTPPRPI